VAGLACPWGPLIRACLVSWVLLSCCPRRRRHDGANRVSGSLRVLRATDGSVIPANTTQKPPPPGGAGGSPALHGRHERSRRNIVPDGSHVLPGRGLQKPSSSSLLLVAWLSPPQIDSRIHNMFYYAFSVPPQRSGPSERGKLNQEHGSRGAPSGADRCRLLTRSLPWLSCDGSTPVTALGVPDLPGSFGSNTLPAIGRCFADRHRPMAVSPISRRLLNSCLFQTTLIRPPLAPPSTNLTNDCACCATSSLVASCFCFFRGEVSTP